MRIDSAGNPGDQGLRESELSYRRLFEEAQDGILILDVHTGRITDVNPFLVNLLGFSRIEMIGQTVGELSPFRDIESNKVMLSRLQKDGYVRYEDLPLETRSGRRVAVEFVSNVYRAGDHDVIQCNIRDITARRSAEMEVRRLNAELDQRVADRTRELLAANTELEAFSNSVSHDLRAPLGHVMSFVELLEMESGTVLSEKSRQYLAAITHATRHMEGLINDLLNLSRIGRSEMHRVDVDLDVLIAEVVADASADLGRRDVRWALEPLPHVLGDRALLRLLFVNLIANAVKFTTPREVATITVSARTGESGDTVVCVRDNGVGFDPQSAHKLFGVFQRLHGRAEFEGTGIGLTNVKRIVTRHGGHVRAEGAVGVGAAFFIALPGSPS